MDCSSSTAGSPEYSATEITAGYACSSSAADSIWIHRRFEEPLNSPSLLICGQTSGKGRTGRQINRRKGASLLAWPCERLVTLIRQRRSPCSGDRERGGAHRNGILLSLR